MLVSALCALTPVLVTGHSKFSSWQPTGKFNAQKTAVPSHLWLAKRPDIKTRKVVSQLCELAVRVSYVG